MSASVEHAAAHDERRSVVTRGAMAPSLTPLDERVMASVRSDGQRAYSIACAVYAPRRGWGRVREPMRPTPEQVAEVRGILRGLEHLGRVTGRGGWWRAL
jgi:hypothetical protein